LAQALQRQQAREIEIERDQYPALAGRFADYVFIGKTLEMLLPQMNCVVAVLAQKCGGAGRRAHVQKQAHALNSP